MILGINARGPRGDARPWSFFGLIIVELGHDHGRMRLCIFDGAFRSAEARECQHLNALIFSSLVFGRFYND